MSFKLIKDHLPWVAPTVAIVFAASGYFDRSSNAEDIVQAPLTSSMDATVASNSQFQATTNATAFDAKNNNDVVTRLSSVTDSSLQAMQPVDTQAMQQAAALAFAPAVVPEQVAVIATPAQVASVEPVTRTASLQATQNAVAFFSDAQASLSARESCIADLRSLSDQARIYFPAGGLNADPCGIEQARLIGILLQDCKGVQIIVEGHSDPSGDADVNLKLSKKRAEQIIQRLCASGIDTMNFVAKGIGSARPSNIVGPESDAYYDRRVEFAVIEVDNTASFNRAKALSNQWATSSCAQDLEAAIAGKNVFYSPRSVAAKQSEISVAFELAAMAMACPDARLRVISQHSDDLRSGESPAMGRLRAKAMMAMLVGQGID
uniref:OmpA family protein n=1 Tax=Planktotalea sp. TaxID=2029877 RepID=UPI0025FD636B